jgi:hypothetical protein
MKRNGILIFCVVLFCTIICSGQTYFHPLPELLGTYSNSRTASIDFGHSFNSICKVSIYLEGYITPGLGQGDGVEWPVLPTFPLPGEVDCFMIDPDPPSSSCDFYVTWFRELNKEVSFDHLLKMTCKGIPIDWDFLLDGTHDVTLEVAGGSGFGIVMIYPPTVTITDAYLIVEDNLYLIKPNRGETYLENTVTTINWGDCISTAPELHLEYSDNNSVSWNTIDPNTENDGYYDWTVPQLTSDQCLLRISDVNDPNAFDKSNDVFNIYECQLPSAGQIADLDDNCYVDFADFSILLPRDLNDFSTWAQQWLNNGNPFDP